jgi:tetratricopeptide (TPR) repeat protein
MSSWRGLKRPDRSEAIEGFEVEDMLASLAEKSLVVSDGDGRSRLLETVRDYGRGLVADAGEADSLRDRHLAHFMVLAEEAEPHFSGPDQQAWLERLETEHDNLRAALEWSCAEGGDSDAGLRLAGVAWRLWYLRGPFAEGRSRIAAQLGAEPRDVGPPGSETGTLRLAARAKVLNGAGSLELRLGDYSAARALYEESLALFRELGDQRCIANLLNNLANIISQQSDYPAARGLFEESVSIRRAMGDRHGLAISLHGLGSVISCLGDHPGARALFEESLAIFRELGDRWYVASPLGSLGLVAERQGDSEAARTLYEESLAMYRETGDRHSIALRLCNLGWVAVHQGDYPAARTLFEESLAIRREMGDRWGIANSLQGLGSVICEQGDYPAACGLQRESLALFREIGDRRSIACAFEGLASALAAMGRPGRAAEVWGASERLREEIGAPVPLCDRPRYDQKVSAARASLNDDAAFDVAWAEGRAMTLEEAIALAMECAAPSALEGSA